MIEEYYRAETVEEAWQYVKLGAKVLGGGGYISKHQEDYKTVVDLQKLNLSGIKENDHYWEIGATEKLQTIVEHKSIPNSLKSAITRFPGSINIRNSATLAGAILVCDGRFDLLSWLLAADTKIALYPHVEDFDLENLYKNGFGLVKHSIITKIKIPKNSRVYWEQISRSPKDATMVGVYLMEVNNSDTYRVCVSGQGLQPKPVTIPKNYNAAVYSINTLLEIAHSHYIDNFCSFSYFKDMCFVLFDRILMEMNNDL